jgi:hypothetical protein
VVGVVAGVDTPRVALVRPETPAFQHTLLVEPERRERL